MQTDKKLPKYCGPHCPSGRGYAWVDRKPVYFPGPHGSPQSLRGYRKLLEKLAGKVQTVGTSLSTVADLCEAWLSEGEKVLSAKSYAHYLKLTENIIEAGMSAYLTADFGPRRVKEFRESLIAKGLARSTINQRVSRLKKMFKWGASEEMVPPDVVSAIYCVSGLVRGQTDAPEPRKVMPVNWTQVQKTMEHLSITVRNMILLQWDTGMRSGNLCSLKMEEIDTSDSIWVYRPESHKNSWRGKGLAIAIGAAGQHAIELSQGKRSRLEFVFRPVDSIEWHTLNNPRYSSWNNRELTDCFTPNTYRQSILRAQAHAAGIKFSKALPTKKDFENCGWVFWTPHQVRHSVSTELRSKYSIEHVRAFMGHATMQATEIYSELDLESAKRIARERDTGSSG